MHRLTDAELCGIKEKLEQLLAERASYAQSAERWLRACSAIGSKIEEKMRAEALRIEEELEEELQGRPPKRTPQA